jgi:septation ring formation regulator EzrA
MDWLQVLAMIASIVTIIGGGGAWIWSRLDRRFDQIDKKFDKIDQRFDKIEDDIKDIRNDMKELRTSVNRLEGAIYSKDCCMLKEEKQTKKAK